MARQVSIHNETILAAARKVFLRHGFRVATARIAREAGISEGSIFKHFKTKSALFQAAMQVESKLQAWEEQLMRSVGTGDIRQTLETAGRQLLQRLQIIIPCLVMIRSSGITIASPNQPPPEIKILTAYFMAENKRGRLVVSKPEALAHTIVGTFSFYAFCETIWGYRPASPSAYIRGMVNMFLQSILPVKHGRKIERTPDGSRSVHRRHPKHFTI